MLDRADCSRLQISTINCMSIWWFETSCLHGFARYRSPLIVIWHGRDLGIAV